MRGKRDDKDAGPVIDVQAEPVVDVHAEPVTVGDPQDLSHLSAHRGLIVRRALLAGAISGFLPVPMLDEKLSGRVRAGLYQKVARGRQVDLPAGAAEELAWSEGAGPLAKATLTSAAAVFARFAGRKVLAVVAAGRGAEAMASTFVRATLFDHYCAKLHVGGPITVADAKRLRTALRTPSHAIATGPLLSAFKDGGRVLGRSLLEAPRWLSQRIGALGELFMRTGGNPDVLDSFPDPDPTDSAWLERAAQAVEDALARAGNGQMERLVQDFEARWTEQAT